MSTRDPMQRFSDRVDDYVRFRPSYPREVIEVLRDTCRVAPPGPVADVGSGTGIFSRLLLDAGYHVAAVEPNEPMRLAGEKALGDRPGFTSHTGSAETTGLPDAAFAAVTVAQAFHWFDRDRTRREFHRILRPHGWVMLVWNERLVNSSFLEGYESLLHRYATDYAAVDHRQVDDAALAAFFTGGEHFVRTFANEQRFDLTGLRGRLSSSSYAPPPNHPNHAPMMAELERLFAVHNRDGEIVFAYRTQAHCGRFAS